MYNGDLYMCEEVPNVLDPSSCEIVWEGTSAKSAVDTEYAAKASSNNEIPSDAPSSSAISVTPSTSSVVSASTSSSTASTRSSTGKASASSSTASTRSSTGTTTASVTDVTSTTSSVTTTTVTFQAAPSAKVNLADDGDSEDESSVESDSDSESDSDDEEEEETKPLLNFVYSRRSMNIPVSQRLLTLDGNVTVNLNGLNGLNEYTLSRKCLYTLNWPIDKYVVCLRSVCA